MNLGAFPCGIEGEIGGPPNNEKLASRHGKGA